MSVENREIRPNVYYTVEEVAALLQVPRRAVARLLASGTAPAVKVGRHWRVLGRDLLSLPNEARGSDAPWSAALMCLSAPAFAGVWDNEEDAVYDDL